MKKIAILLAVTLAVVSCRFVSYTGDSAKGAGRIVCKGEVEIRTLEGLSGFEGITVNGQADVFFSQGTQFEVRVKANQEVFDYLDYEVRGGTLVLKTVDMRSLKAETFDVLVTAPTLKEVTVNGASDFRIRDYRAYEDLKVTVNGAGDFDLERLRIPVLSFTVNGAGDIRAEEIAVEKLSVDVNGAGDVKVSGKADSAAFSVSGAGDIDARNLDCKDIRTKKSGLTSIRLPK